jgi:hypothetical protein
MRKTFLLFSALLGASALQGQDKPCIAAPPKKPSLADIFKKKAKKWAQSTVETQVGRVDETVGQATKHKVELGAKDTVHNVATDATQLKPCTPTPTTK